MQFKTISCVITLFLSLAAVSAPAQADDEQTRNAIAAKAMAAHRNFDYATALKLWRVSAEKGDPNAQYHLGRMYQLGQGVTQSDSVAKAWYRLAAAGGHNVAQAKLDTMRVR